jgi:5-methylcytosine-specific restriction endonuclease McrA
MKTFKGKPSNDAIWWRDGGIDQYTGKKLNRDDATVDHVVPRSRGGSDRWENLALTHRNINTVKGNKLNTEAGLKLIKPPKAPAPMPKMMMITHPAHITWTHFIVQKD